MSTGERVFRLLLLLYPPAFRRRYRNELVAFFTADRDRAGKHIGTARLVLFWYATIVDLLRAAGSQWMTVFADVSRRTSRRQRYPKPHRRRGAPQMEILLQDLKYAMRTFRKSPAFTVIALATLALGIGTNAAMFTVVDGVLFENLPYGNVDRVVSVWGTATDGDFGVSENERLRYREQPEIFDAFGTFYFTAANISGPDGAERLTAAAMDAGVLPSLGVNLAIGRPFLEGETVSGSDRVIILSHGLWQQRFGGSPDVLGQTITVNGLERTIVGVLPGDFRLPGDFVGPPAQLYLANLFGDPDPRNLHYFQAVARLVDGITVMQARARMSQVGLQLAEELPSLPSSFVPATVPVEEVVTGEIRPLLIILLGAVGLLLLIACANVANLSLARADTRSTEMAVRAALGAGRGRLIRQLMSESVVLAVTGGILALFLAEAATRLVVRFNPPNIPRIDQLGVDMRVVLFTAIVSLLAALAFGLIPAIAGSANRIHSSLHEGGRARTGSVGKNRLRRALVVGEVALALTLTAGAGLLIRSFAHLTSTDSGFDPQGVLTLRTTLPLGRYADSESARVFYSELLDEIRVTPGVVRAGAVTALPLSSDPGDWGIRIEGREDEYLDGGRRPWADRIIVTDGYFEAMGIEIVEGRSLRRDDAVGGREVVVINATAAQRYWPGESAIGKRFILSTNIDSVFREVVGVTQDVKHGGLAQETKPEMYLPHAQHPASDQFPVGTMTLVVRTSVEPVSIAGTVRRVVSDIDREVPMSDVATMTDIIAASTSTEQLNVSLFATFGVLALLLVSVGVYGVMSYLITQRSKDLGIRIALGAGPRAVLGMVIGHGMTLTVIGAGMGMLGALALGRVLSGLLYGISWYDPITLGATALLVTVVAFVACAQPARRATRLDPIRVLRAE